VKLKRIHILGGPGSGKTYLAEKLADSLNISAFDLDDIFWDSKADCYGVRASEEARDQQLQSLLRRNTWIVEGVYYAWLNDSFSRADLIIILIPNPWLRAWRIIKRYIMRKFGMIHSKKETFKDFLQLIQWNHRYDHANLRDAQKMIRQFEHKTFVCKKADEAVQYIKNLML